MGGAKREQEREDARRMWALSVAVESGVLVTCKRHPEVLLEGSGEIVDAYKLANTKFSSGEIDGMFESRREMTDMIDSVVADNNGDECYSCEKWKDS